MKILFPAPHTSSPCLIEVEIGACFRRTSDHDRQGAQVFLLLFQLPVVPAVLGVGTNMDIGLQKSCRCR